MFKIILDRIVQQFKNLLQQQTHVSDRENDIGVAVDNAKTLSSYGTQLISSFEGLALIAYQCPANVWTIGSGTTVYPSGQPVHQGDTCSLEQALAYKAYDLMRFSQLVNRVVNVPLTQNQFDSLVSLAYNIGPHAFEASTLLKKLNVGDYYAAAEQFLRWDKSKGQILKGLVKRRAAEKKLFLT